MKRFLSRLFDYFVVLLLITIASFLIAFGIYLTRINNPKIITKKGIDLLGEKLLGYLNDYQYLKTDGNFTIDLGLKLKIESDEYKEKSLTDPTYKEKLNLINNLSKMDYKLQYIENNDKKNSYLEILEKTPEEEIVSYKQVVTNSTDYFLINKVSDKYVNNGTNNYFETLTEENTTKDNIKYLYDKLLEAINNSIKEEYLDQVSVSTYVLGGQKELNKIQIHLNDKTIHKILNDILKYLKNDEKSKILLSYIDEDFINYKVDNDKVIIKSDEDININIYYGGIFPKIEKVEYYYLKGNDKKVLYATGNSKNGEIYYVENDNTKYIMNYTINDNIKVDIKDNKGTQIGFIDYSKSDDNILLTYTFDNGIKKQDLSYTSKYYKQESSYQNEKKITWKYIDNKVIKMNIEAEEDYTVSNNAVVDQDISDAVLKSTLTEEQLSTYKNYKKIVEDRLKNG